MMKLYIPCPSKESAKKISRALLQKRLIACANIWPIESMYWWKGRIEEAGEFVILASSEKSFYRKIVAEVTKMHPYEVPLIAKIDVSANKAYLKWLHSCIK